MPGGGFHRGRRRKSPLRFGLAKYRKRNFHSKIYAFLSSHLQQRVCHSMPELDDFPPQAVSSIIQQVTPLCQTHDHIARVIANLALSTDEFQDQYTQQPPNGFDFEPMVRLLLYQHICEFSATATHDRLNSWAYLVIRFGLNRAPT